MSTRDDALAALAAAASSPDAVAASPAHMLAAVDAIVDVFTSADTSSLSDRQAAVRSPRAAWASVFTLAENRMRNLRLAKKTA